MRKAFVIVLVVGLLAGSLVGSADAKKRRLVPSELKFFLHWEQGSDDCNGAIHMNLKDTPDPGSGCEFVFQPAQEVLVAAGQEKLSRDWPASAGPPFVLDASRPVTGEIALRGGAMAQAYVDILLTGSTRGRGTEIVNGITEKVNGAYPGTVIAEFSLEPAKKLDKKVFTRLNLNTATRGVTAATWIELDNPPSFIVVPVLVPKG